MKDSLKKVMDKKADEDYEIYAELTRKCYPTVQVSNITGARFSGVLEGFAAAVEYLEKYPEDLECLKGLSDSCIFYQNKWYEAQSLLNEGKNIIEELMDLINGVRENDYVPDTFTNQPAQIFLKKLK